ncbi:MAG: hypothetical protein KC910_23725, partial [Candidatus Eremiobacteraeota bacterium]|nr:hypothetical protein [Candidatus Eremiobacteraeota bacterium]
FLLLNQKRSDGAFPHMLNTSTMRFHYAQDPGEGEIAVAVSNETAKPGSGPSKFAGQCLECGAEKALSILGSRAATLSSVAISLLFNTPYNQDKKMLAFTDSVQDASHRSGFFGARTYRFHLRTQLQRVLEEHDHDLPLTECVGALLAQGEPAHLLAGFWPSDLDDYPLYLEALEKGNPQRVWPQLETRLGWEIAMEYGYSARVGRTLEKTGCSTVYFDPGRLTKAAEALAQDLVEARPIAARHHDPATVAHFLEALLHRLRVRGGVLHPLLRGYLEKDGNSYFLSKKKNPLLSPFPRGSRLPRFLHSHSSHDVFDTYRGSTLHWYRDWASRCLGAPQKDDGLGQFYALAVKRLDQHGLLETLASGQGQASGLRPEAMWASRQVGQVVCPDCGQRTTLAGPAVQGWVGKLCPRFRCHGRLQASAIQESYYGRIYRSGHTTRIVSSEHTGLLQRPDRELLEERFKRGAPGDPNLLVCTPTLELGVDVGDLSATMVCSVPPATANYLQRMGRAGRQTGNAFCLSMALTRPHDLYFYTQPKEMMAGQVLPPGCFLNAPEMLKRQMVAFVLDCWAAQEDELSAVPRHAFQTLGAGREKFPGRAIAFFQQHQAQLTARFLELFEDELDGPNRQAMQEFGLGPDIPRWLDDAFEAVAERRNELRKQVDHLEKRFQQVEQDPDSSDDPDTEKRELEDARRVLKRLLKELREKYILNFFTDAGLLPNYAFPEPGVTLRSVVKRKDEGPFDERYETREYVRAASAAIREFAPFNSFYAEGRKVQIRQIDIGSSSQPLFEQWRFCPDCHYMTRQAEGKAPERCPRCSCPGFADTGQLRVMVPFRRASAFSNPLESISVDETEERQNERYTTVNLIDVGPEHMSGARLIEGLPFGFELLQKVTLREVNFGQHRPTGGHLRVAGQPIHEDGFTVCDQCGKVQEGDKIEHAFHCKYRRGTFKEKSKAILLYREVQSEAIRLLLPMAAENIDARRASFEAALQLGLRRYFKGNPGHLLVKAVSEPDPNSGARRHYLVLYDGVPGGTGYLADLWKDDHL